MSNDSQRLRPDVDLQAGDARHVLRPDWKALDAIERRLETGIPMLLRRLRTGDVRFRDCAVVLEEANKAAGGKLTFVQAFELTQSHFTEVTAAVSKVIGGAFGPPPTGGAAENPPPAG